MMPINDNMQNTDFLKIKKQKKQTVKKAIALLNRIAIAFHFLKDLWYRCYVLLFFIT